MKHACYHRNEDTRLQWEWEYTRKRSRREHAHKANYKQPSQGNFSRPSSPYPPLFRQKSNSTLKWQVLQRFIMRSYYISIYNCILYFDKSPRVQAEIFNSMKSGNVQWLPRGLATKIKSAFLIKKTILYSAPPDRDTTLNNLYIQRGRTAMRLKKFEILLCIIVHFQRIRRHIAGVKSFGIKVA